MGRLFAIGDIHGEFGKLNEIIYKLEVDGMDLAEDKLIFLGDYVDRGPHSLQVLKTINDLFEAHPKNVVLLAGNHEWLMIDGVRKLGDCRDLWYRNGGMNTVASFQGTGERMEDWSDWLSELPFFHEEPGFFFSHAPVYYPAKPPYDKHTLTWSYRSGGEGMEERIFPNGVVGVCGHIHQLVRGYTWPRLYKHYIYTDAGCGCSDEAPLAAIEVRSRKIYLSDETKGEPNE